MEKILIMSDMEGVTGLSHWDEANKEKQHYNEFREILTNEINVICNTIGTKNEIVVDDQHWTGRNIQIHDFNENIKIRR